MNQKEVLPQNELNLSLFKAQTELQPIVKGSANPFFKSNYADLNSILESVNPVLHKNGLFITQATQTNTQANFVETVVTHAGTGQSITSRLLLPNIEDPQKLGSAITYARRYTLQSLLGLQTVDDDGNLASGKSKPKAKKKVINDDF